MTVDAMTAATTSLSPDGRRRSRPAAGSTIAAVVLLLLAAGCSDGGDPASEVSAAGSKTAVEKRPEMSFTFTGDEGPQGCQYDGPRTIDGSPMSTMVNATDGLAYVSFAKVAEGARPGDFDAHLATLGASYPVYIPREMHDPAVHTWMQGGWREIHHARPGETHRVTTPGLFTEGTYVMFCYRDAAAGSGSELWPLGHLTVVAS